MKSLSALLVVLSSFTALSADDAVSTINYSVVLECPPSLERNALESIIPAPDYQPLNAEEWARTTIDELEHMIALIRSGKFKNGTVTFDSSNNRARIDESKLSAANLSLHFLCADSEELESLRLAGGENAKKLGSTDWSEWSAQAMRSLQNVQMLIFKGKVAVVKSQKLENRQNGLQDAKKLTEVKCTFDLKGPLSHEFQALLDVIPKEDTRFKNYREWSLATIDAIHKLEMLILSGKVNLANSDIEVIDLN